jgi:DNA topoisomerase III
MITIFAEKPDVGTKIAAALDAIVLSSGDRVDFDHIQKYEKQIKAQRAKQGYFKIRHNGEETYVTWGIGHLCELKQAQDYNKEYKQWKNIPLPFIPESYELKCSKGMEKQLRLIKNIFDHSDLIICATDDDREGDLIFDYIYRYLNCSVPFKRALFNQQSKEEWQKAFRKENLVDGIKRKPVIEAGRGRSAGDFVVGANLTTAMTLKFPGNNVLSVGRVQTAVLSMLVARELEIQNFKPKDYWVLKGKFNSEHGSYEGTHVVKKFDKESDADEILRKLSADTGPATVKSIKEKSFWREKPYLYSLQGLQMDANKVYGFSLQHTLDLAQSLYEKGFTTYPRTDSSHLTDDMGPEMKKVIQMLFSSDTYSKFKSHATESVDSSNKYYFDSSKVESHYAIVPTSKKLSLGQMSDDEKKLYDMIARSVICICYPKAQLSKTNIITEKSGEEFTTCGISILKPGYFEVLGRPRENLLPKLQERESVQGKYIKEAKKLSRQKDIRIRHY